MEKLSRSLRARRSGAEIYRFGGKDDVKLAGARQVILMTLRVGQFHFHRHILKLQACDKQPGLSANRMHHNVTPWEWQ